MMDTGFPELTELRVTVPDDTRDEQWAVIAQAMADVPARPQMSFRRRVAIWVAAAFSVGLPATAVAAEAALPGDLLYPVKLVVEPVRSLFDPDVAANHRVEELERLAVSDAPAGDINRAFDRAQRAVDDTASPELAQRVERVREQIRDSRSGGEDATDRATESAPSGDGPATTVTDSSPDAGTRSTTTTTDDDGRSGDRLQGSDGSGSTTTSPRQGSTSSSADRGGDGRTSAGG